MGGGGRGGGGGKTNMMKDHQTENENAFVSLLLFRKNEGYNTK